MNKINSGNKGFTLVEMLIYLSILAVISGLFIGILNTTTRVQIRESASNEVSNQANFVLQTIQRLVRSASNIEETGGDNSETTTVVENTYLKLRMPLTIEDPTCIAQVGTAIRITKGSLGGSTDEKCKESTSSDDVTTSKVNVPLGGLIFQKFTNYPGHDTVQIDLTLNYNDPNPAAQYSKKLESSVSRVSAATFDSDLLTDATLKDIGSSLAPTWRNLYLSDNTGSNVAFKVEDGKIYQPDNYGAGGRGYMMVGFSGTNISCTNICGGHTASCHSGYKFETDGTVSAFVCATLQTATGICFCN